MIHTPQSKEHQDESPLGRVKQGFSLGPLVTLWFGVYDLQDQETIKFCSLKHPVYSNLCLKLKKSVYPSKLYILVVLNLQCLVVLKSTILVSPNTKAKPTTGTRCFETYMRWALISGEPERWAKSLLWIKQKGNISCSFYQTALKCNRLLSKK